VSSIIAVRVIIYGQGDISMEWDKDKIRAFRKRLSLTQYQFAELLGTSQDIISGWETGKQSPCGISQKFLTLLVSKDIKKDIEEIKSNTEKEKRLSPEKLLAFRKELGFSQAQFARKIGRDASTISYWERGEKSPGKKSQSFLRKLAKEERIELQELGKETEDCDTSTSGTSNRGGANFTNSPSDRSDRLTHNFLPEPNIRIVGSGIDKLYLGFYVEVNEKLLNTLEAAKAEASNSSFGEALISIGKNTFTIKPYNQDRYRYILSNGDMGLQVAEGNADSYPNVYVDMESLYILETSVDSAVNEVRSFVSSNFGSILREKVSRVEMYVDVAGEKVYLQDVDKFVSRAGIRNFHQVYGEFTGFELGKGDIRAKVYNKKEEIKKSHKEYMYSIWNGVSKDEEVWRIEFELKRRALKAWDVEDYDSFKARNGDIWKYLTEEWLSMREQDNKNTTRRSLTELWEEVQKARLSFGKVTGALRNNKRIVEIEHYISQMRGCATAISARQHLSGEDGGFDSVFSLVTTKIREQLVGKEGGSLTEEEIKALSDILFEQEALRKAVNCK
jgi:DNA-binding transcriptional regulator YiaG